MADPSREDRSPSSGEISRRDRATLRFETQSNVAKKYLSTYLSLPLSSIHTVDICRHAIFRVWIPQKWFCSLQCDHCSRLRGRKNTLRRKNSPTLGGGYARGVRWKCRLPAADTETYIRMANETAIRASFAVTTIRSSSNHTQCH
jgi:hypothetical protein